MSDKLHIFYPGVYSEEEAAAIERFKTEEMKPLFGELPGPAPADEFSMRVFAAAWDRWNPLFNDPEYAKNSVWGGLIAMPCYRAPTARSILPQELGSMATANGVSYQCDAYDHEVIYHRPIYAGDTFTVKNKPSDIHDATPKEGSEGRVLVMICSSEMYNQNGELVATVINRWPEIRKRITDPSLSPEEQRQLLMGRDGPPPKGAKKKPGGGMYVHPRHTYTQEDYDRMVSIWKAEKIRGKEPLYWEDVQIGDFTPITCEPPQHGLELIRNMGCAETLGQPGLREMFLTGAHKGNYHRDEETGLYSTGTTRHIMGTGGGYASLYNHHCRAFVVRMLTNWIGDNGFVSRVGWRFVNDIEPERQINKFPADSYRPSKLLLVPGMEGRFLNTHGQGYDAFVIHGYVYNKYADETGHYADVICWAEDFDGNIAQECDCTVKLPSKHS